MNDDDLASSLVLLRLGGIGPSRIRWLTERHSPFDVVHALRRGVLPDGLGPSPPRLEQSTTSGWFRDASSLDGHRDLDEHRMAGVEVLAPDHPQWPFLDDPEPPALMFALGDLDLARSGRRVGIVGTRRCTTVGRRVARQLGLDLADPSRCGGDVHIVSGLALGIDAEAHHGALLAGGSPIGVVASGLDVPYPKKNEKLWHRVGSEGLLVSESPLGMAPARWKFPARNRLIAAMSDLVVVVESHAEGGALSTADEAADRGVTVGAVPGSVMSRASDGTNALLADGCPPVRHADDILGLLGLSGDRSVASSSARATQLELQVSDPLGERIVAEAANGPVRLEHLMLSFDVEHRELFVAAQRLVASGVLTMVGSTLTWRQPGKESGSDERGSGR